MATITVSGSGPQPVPEPGSLSLLSCAGILLFGYARWRRQQAVGCVGKPVWCRGVFQAVRMGLDGLKIRPT